MLWRSILGCVSSHFNSFAWPPLMISRIGYWIAIHRKVNPIRRFSVSRSRLNCFTLQVFGWFWLGFLNQSFSWVLRATHHGPFRDCRVWEVCFYSIFMCEKWSWDVRARLISPHREPAKYFLTHEEKKAPLFVYKLNLSPSSPPFHSQHHDLSSPSSRVQIIDS